MIIHQQVLYDKSSKYDFWVELEEEENLMVQLKYIKI